MTAWPSVLHTAELGDLAEDVRRLLQELGATSWSRSTAAGDCVPPLDVIETDEAVEILVDVPGVAAASLRVLLKGSVVLIAGEKWVAGPGPELAVITWSNAAPAALHGPCASAARSRAAASARP